MSYHDPVLGPGRGGFAYAIQPHREVRPESGSKGGFVVATRSRTPVALTSLAGNQFMKAYRIMTPFWARGEGEGEEKRKKRRGEREGYCRAQASSKARHTITLSRIVGVRIYPLTLAMALAQHLVRWGERRK